MGNEEKRKERERRLRKQRGLKRQQNTAAGIPDGLVPSPMSLMQPPLSIPSSPTTGRGRPLGPGDKPGRISLSFQHGARGLAQIGPIVSGQWSVPAVLAERLRSAGGVVPPPVAGFFLIDTGASQTCISTDVAEELGLKAIAVGKTYGAGGVHHLKRFFATCALSSMNSKGTIFQVGGDRLASGVPNMNDHFKTFGVRGSEEDVASMPLIGLLGRDFLAHATFTYRGATGSFEVLFEGNTLAQPPDVTPAIVAPPNKGD